MDGLPGRGVRPHRVHPAPPSRRASAALGVLLLTDEEGAQRQRAACLLLLWTALPQKEPCQRVTVLEIWDCGAQVPGW